MVWLKPWISKITSTIPVEYDEESGRTLREVEAKGIEIYFLGLYFSIGIRVKEADFRPFFKKRPPKPLNSSGITERLNISPDTSEVLNIYQTRQSKR